MHAEIVYKYYNEITNPLEITNQYFLTAAKLKLSTRHTCAKNVLVTTIDILNI